VLGVADGGKPISELTHDVAFEHYLKYARGPLSELFK